MPEVLPFKNCRFFYKPDDSGYISQMAYYDNWPKDEGQKFKKEDIRTYPLFNPAPRLSCINAIRNVRKHPGQVFSLFSTIRICTHSPFDSVYLDADSEWQLSIYQNRELRMALCFATL